MASYQYKGLASYAKHAQIQVPLSFHERQAPAEGTHPPGQQGANSVLGATDQRHAFQES